MKAKRPRVTKDIPATEVRALAAQNKTLLEIAKHFWCSRDTIVRNFDAEVKEGWADWHNKTKKLVRDLSSIHCTKEEIAAVTGVSNDTLERRFMPELETGRLVGKVSLRRKQYEMFMQGDKTMAVWLGKQYLGQRDKLDLSLVPAEIIAVEVERRGLKLVSGGAIDVTRSENPDITERIEQLKAVK